MKNHTHVKKLEHTLGFSLLGGGWGKSNSSPPPAKNLLIPLPPRKIPLNQIFVPPFPPTKSQFPPINNFQVITQ